MIKADINSGCKLSHEIVLEIDLDDLMKHGIVVSNLAEMVESLLNLLKKWLRQGFYTT